MPVIPSSSNMTTSYLSDYLSKKNNAHFHISNCQKDSFHSSVSGPLFGIDLNLDDNDPYDQLVKEARSQETKLKQSLNSVRDKDPSDEIPPWLSELTDVLPQLTHDDIAKCLTRGVKKPENLDRIRQRYIYKVFSNSLCGLVKMAEGTQLAPVISEIRETYRSADRVVGAKAPDKEKLSEIVERLKKMGEPSDSREKALYYIAITACQAETTQKPNSVKNLTVGLPLLYWDFLLFESPKVVTQTSPEAVTKLVQTILSGLLVKHACTAYVG